MHISFASVRRDTSIRYYIMSSSPLRNELRSFLSYHKLTYFLWLVIIMLPIPVEYIIAINTQNYVCMDKYIIVIIIYYILYYKQS